MVSWKEPTQIPELSTGVEGQDTDPQRPRRQVSDGLSKRKLPARPEARQTWALTTRSPFTSDATLGDSQPLGASASVYKMGAIRGASQGSGKD